MKGSYSGPSDLFPSTNSTPYPSGTSNASGTSPPTMSGPITARLGVNDEASPNGTKRLTTSLSPSPRSTL